MQTQKKLAEFDDNGRCTCDECHGAGGYIYSVEGDDDYKNETARSLDLERYNIRYAEKVEAEINGSEEDKYYTDLTYYKYGKYTSDGKEIRLYFPADDVEQAEWLERFWNPVRCDRCNGTGKVDWITRCMRKQKN